MRSDIVHGTLREGYWRGCRCPQCRAASAAYTRELRKKRMAATLPAHIPHGTLATYTNWKCHCEQCRAALAAYRKATRRQQTEGGSN